MHGLDGDFAVPVIGRDDRDNVDIFPVEHAAIIFVGVGFFAGDFLAPFFQMIFIDIADGHDVAEFFHLRADGAVPAIARADAADDVTIVFGFLLSAGGFGGEPVGSERGRG